MVVLILERVPASLRGELTRWMIEPATGVFLGRISAMVRDSLWQMACARLKTGGAFLAYTTDTEQGFEFRLAGRFSRPLRDFEGLLLVNIP